TQTAVLCSASKDAAALLAKVAADATTLANGPLLTRLTALAARTDPSNLSRIFELLAGQELAGWQFAVLEGLGQGLQGSLEKIWQSPPAHLREAVQRARPMFTKAAALAKDEKR